VSHANEEHAMTTPTATESKEGRHGDVGSGGPI